MKTIAAALGAWAWTILGPALPVAAACTGVVLADVWSARRLAARLGKTNPTARQKLKFTSARFGRVVKTLLKIYTVLALAALLEREVVGEWVHLLKFTGAIICFWQCVSILENEASCNDHPWARSLGRYLVDKSSRYLSTDELPFTKD